jgi:hypothetical protein
MSIPDNDSAGINFGPGPVSPESQPVPLSDIMFLHITESTQLQFTQPQPENSFFSGSCIGVSDLSRALVYRPAGA